MKIKLVAAFFAVCLLIAASVTTPGVWALASNNIPLDSPIYLYLEKLAGFGVIKSDIKGIKPFSKSEAARLVLEAEKNMQAENRVTSEFAVELISRLRKLIPREMSLHDKPEKAPCFDYILFSSGRARYVYLDGVPRSYERPVHDPGGDGVFGIGSGLRPDNPYPSPVQQHGTEGTPLLGNNEGIQYRRGNNLEFRSSSEAYVGRQISTLIEPLVLYSNNSGGADISVNKGYVKLGGGGLELEVGRDSNWLGIGYHTAITLSDNAKNFDMVKLSSPEPLNVAWVKRYLGEVKYSLIFSRFDHTVTDGLERQPYFFGAKVSIKPTDNLELGINMGRQQGGPGVSNSAGEWVRGLLGGTNSDNSNSVAGLELRVRLPFMRNAEIYGEFSGEDTAAFWPIVESYVAGLYIPRVTDNGRNDFRFEYYLGNAILSTNYIFPEGYIYNGMNIGPSQGGASEEFFSRCSHWFSVRNNLALEYIHSERGNLGRVTVNSAGVFDSNGVKQAVERRNAARLIWQLPLYGDMDMNLLYGWEQINNMNLVGGVNRTNQIFMVDLRYRY